MSSTSAAVALQLKSRAREETLRANYDYTVANSKVAQRVKWENHTHDKLAEKRKAQRVTELQREASAQLLARKRQLANLFNAEMDSWQKEFAAEKESPVDRKAALQARALKLRDDRERERRAFADKMYKLQWQQSCDDGRLLDSKATLGHVVDVRSQQIGHKAVIEQKLKEEEERKMVEWKQRLDELDSRENEKEAFRAAMEKEIKGMLDAQVEANHAKKKALKDRKAADAKEELEELKAAIEREEAKDNQRLALARQRGAETREFNQARLGIRAEATEEQKRRDLMLLNYALEKERASNNADAAKKGEEKATVKRYQAYLEAQMIKEREETGFADALRKAEEDKIWDMRDAEQQRRKDERAESWRKTHDGRQEQIRLKMQREMDEMEYDRTAGAADRAAAHAELDRIEAEKQAAMKQARMENLMGIQAQKAHNGRGKRREEQSKYLEAKVMAKTEVEHKERLTGLGGEVKVNFPNKHTQWYT